MRSVTRFKEDRYVVQMRKINLHEADVLVHTYNTSTGVAEAGLWIQG